jgi:hypothetical protein
MSNRAKQVPYDGELNVSPWESILTEVRRSGYRSSWIDERIEREAQAEHDLEAQAHDWDDSEKFERTRLAQSRELREWIKLGRDERAHGAQVAASAVRAGLSERYIESVQAEARNIANVLQRALQAAELSDEQWLAATAELRLGLADMGRELSARHSSLGGRIPTRSEIEG